MNSFLKSISSLLSNYGLSKNSCIKNNLTCTSRDIASLQRQLDAQNKVSCKKASHGFCKYKLPQAILYDPVKIDKKRGKQLSSHIVR